MKHTLILLQFLLAVTVASFAQTTTTTPEQEAAYTKTINQRAEKIVAVLGIRDAAKASKVQSTIAAQYRNLSDIQKERDSKIKTIKEKGEAKETTAENIRKVEEEASLELNRLHAAFLAALASQLTNEQVAQVKDGLTYNVVPITYKGYLDMLPNLTDEQKAQIMSWLIEAREHAMDAETSEKKHGWFGKYKGRINNYLSAAGYDLKKEGEAWQKRLKEREEKKNTTKN